MYRYSNQIEKLEFIVNNWDRINRECTLVSDKFFDKFNCNIRLKVGLCYNCSLDQIEISIKHRMFESFPNYSGDVSYPLGRLEFIDFSNFANNPDRLLLAKHCIHYLKNLDNI